MAKRQKRGLQHWLGRFQSSQKRLPPEIALRYYMLLRYAKNPETRRKVRDKLVLSHIGLGFSHALRFIIGREWDAEEIISLMLEGLIEAVELIGQGRIDNHHPEPNISGYITVTIQGKMRRYIMEKHLPNATLKEFRSTVTPDRTKSLELKEALELVKLTDSEKYILQLRSEGYKDKEIGELVIPNKSSQWIGQVRNNVKTRLMKILEK